MSPRTLTSLAEALDTRAIEIAAATERALQAHELTCREREDRREARSAEFRDEMRRALAELRTSLREVNLTIDRLHWRIVTTLLSTVAGLLGLSGWLATKLLEW